MCVFVNGLNVETNEFLSWSRILFFFFYSLRLNFLLNFVAPSHSFPSYLSILFSISFCFLCFAFMFVYMVCVDSEFFIFFACFNFMQLLLATVPMLFMRSCLSIGRVCVHFSWHTFLSLSHAFAMHEWHSYGYIFIRLGRIDDEYCRSGLSCN